MTAVKNEAEAEEYHHWRAQTISLLVPKAEGKWSPTFDTGPVLKRISRFGSRLRRKLRPWATGSLSEGKERLYTILSASVALDLKMKRERADYRFVTFTGGRKDQYWGYGFYDSEMEDLYEEGDGHGGGGYSANGVAKSRRVELALAPALERCGNANGHVFEQSFILVKAEVSCKRLEKKQPLPKSRGSSTKSKTKGIKVLGGMWNKYA